MKGENNMAMQLNKTKRIEYRAEVYDSDASPSQIATATYSVNEDGTYSYNEYVNNKDVYKLKPDEIKKLLTDFKTGAEQDQH
jgi:hypothetical protein